MLLGSDACPSPGRAAGRYLHVRALAPLAAACCGSAGRYPQAAWLADELSVLGGIIEHVIE
jgi:hypothetical protein